MSITVIDNGYLPIIVAILLPLSELCFYMHTNAIAKNFLLKPNKQKLDIKLFLFPVLINFITIQIATFYIIYILQNGLACIVIILYFTIVTFMKGNYVSKTIRQLAATIKKE